MGHTLRRARRVGLLAVVVREVVLRQTALAVMQNLERAFTAFGGVPHDVLLDQMKAVIVADHRGQGGRLLENEEFTRFEAHWPQWTPQIRPLIDTAKPATTPAS